MKSYQRGYLGVRDRHHRIRCDANLLGTPTSQVSQILHISYRCESVLSSVGEGIDFNFLSFGPQCYQMEVRRFDEH